MIEKKTAEEKLSEILDIELTPQDPPEIAKVASIVREVRIKRKDQLRHDFDSARKNMKELIKKRTNLTKKNSSTKTQKKIRKLNNIKLK